MTVQILGRTFPATATYVVALASALFLVILTVVAAFVQAQRQEADNNAVRHSLEVRSSFRQALIYLLQAESSQRGYLLTGEAIYLEPYEGAVQIVRSSLDQLGMAAADEPIVREDVDALRVLATRKIDEMSETIRRRQTQGRGTAMNLVNTDVGRDLMTEARRVAVGAISREDARLTQRLSLANNSADTLQLIIVLAGLLLVTIGVLMVVAVRDAMRDLRQSRDEAERARGQVVQEMATRKSAEAKLVHAQKMEAVGQLTGGVAHDFNNMLAVIVSAISMARRRLEKGDHDSIARFLDAAHDGATRAATLTGRLLQFARRHPLTPSVFNANQLVGGMSELLRRTLGEDVQMETVLAGGLWNVEADAGQLENAMINICVNARDAMPGGGKLTLETANTHLDERYAASNAEVTPGQYVMIAITDTGRGMAPEVIARAFEPFFTTKDVGKGTGLGLSQAHGFLKQSGGHVAIYSELGVGTTVKLYLPRSAKEVEAATLTEVRDGDTPMGDPATVILVVEDEERVRHITVAALKEFGYTVLSADSGAAALSLLSTTPDVALLFTDIVMPDMNGRVLADKVRAERPNLRVLFTTGYTQNAIVHNGVVDAGAHLLMKPYALAALARKVRAVLDEKK